VIQHHEVPLRLETAPPQVVGAGQPSLPSAYDDDIDLAEFTRLRPGVVHASTNPAGVRDLPEARRL
jgi:hypothetical protein